jgi:hypothetical protein
VYPDVMAALDDALFSRISSLPPAKVRGVRGLGVSQGKEGCVGVVGAVR